MCMICICNSKRADTIYLFLQFGRCRLLAICSTKHTCVWMSRIAFSCILDMQVIFKHSIADNPNVHWLTHRSTFRMDLDSNPSTVSKNFSVCICVCFVFLAAWPRQCKWHNSSYSPQLIYMIYTFIKWSGISPSFARLWLAETAFTRVYLRVNWPLTAFSGLFGVSLCS